MVGLSALHPKVEGLNPATGAESEKWDKNRFFLLLHYNMLVNQPNCAAGIVRGHLVCTYINGPCGPQSLLVHIMLFSPHAH